MQRKLMTSQLFIGPRRERGVALFISLVLLLVLTIIGVSSVQTSSLETRMARNEHDSLLAFQAAESALRDAENFLGTINTLVETEQFTEDGDNGLWNVAAPGDPDPWSVAANWEPGAGNREADTELSGDVAAPPRFMIEHLANIAQVENPYQIQTDYPDPTDRVAMFRITAAGTGGTENAVVLLQTTFGRLID